MINHNFLQMSIDRHNIVKDAAEIGLDLTMNHAFFIGASDLFETARSFWPGMADDFFECDLKFSFGDSNRTLVTTERMADEIERCLGDEEQWTDEADAWIEKVRSLHYLFIDLES
jgi:hypothetical protein